MPLKPGSGESVISSNIKEMQNSGHPHDQSVAAALHNADKYRRGGKLGVMRPMKMHEPHHVPHFGGLFHSSGAGRTDNMHVSVKPNSYIVPADVVSAGLGEGNTLAGARALDSLTGVKGSLPSGMPGSMASGKKGPGATPGMKFSSGGTSNFVKIIVAGGEYNIPPESVEKIGRDALEKSGKKASSRDHAIREGHSVLDAFVKHVRKKTVDGLKKLPGPKT